MAPVGQVVAGASGTLPARIMAPALAQPGRGAVWAAAGGHVVALEVEPVLQSGRAWRWSLRFPESRRARRSTVPS